MVFVKVVSTQVKLKVILDANGFLFFFLFFLEGGGGGAGEIKQDASWVM